MKSNSIWRKRSEIMSIKGDKLTETKWLNISLKFTVHGKANLSQTNFKQY